MKSKTKKILATACLGLVGMGCMTGCAMSDEQKAALDLVTEKTDEIVNLLESNLEFNNKTLSKAEAAEKILIGRNVFKFASFDSFEMSMLQNEYYGVFDKIKNTYTNDATTPWRWLYRKSGDTKIFASAEGETLDSIKISNFATDEHLEWDSRDVVAEFSTREYDTDDFVFDEFDKFLTGFVAAEITSDHIKDIVNTETGYEFTTYAHSPAMAEGADVESRLSITYDGFITKWVCKAVFKINGEYESAYVEFNFKYNDVNFSLVDTKIAELQNN